MFITDIGTRYFFYHIYLNPQPYFCDYWLNNLDYIITNILLPVCNKALKIKGPIWINFFNKNLTKYVVKQIVSSKVIPN